MINMESEMISKTEIQKFNRDLITNIISEIHFEENYFNMNMTDSLNNSELTTQYIKEYFQFIPFKEKYTITMIKTKQQHGGALCGFYCLYNIINFLQFLKNRDDMSRQLFYLQKLNSTSQFWLFYKETLKFLLDSNQINKSDKKILKDMGPLERYQFKYLLNNKPDLKKITSSEKNFDIKFFHYFYGFNFIQSMSKQEIKDLQYNLEYFKNYKKQKSLIYVLLLGITNHWSVIILENTNGEIKNYYLDSNNHNVFHLNPFDRFEMDSNLPLNFDSILKKNEEIEKYAEDCCKELEEYRIKPISIWFKKCYKEWIIDINIVMKDLFKILYENFSIYEIVLNSLIIRLTNTFEEYNTCVLDNFHASDDNLIVNMEEIFLMKEKILLWLTVEYHPQILKVDLLNSFEAYEDSFDIRNLVVFKKFASWIKFSKNIKRYIYEEDIIIINDPEKKEKADMIKRYYDVIHRLEKYL